MNLRLPKFARTSSVAGALVWSAIAFVRISPSIEQDLITKILLLGILVVVPLGLALVATPDRRGRHSAIYNLAVRTQPAAALLALISFFPEPGPVAAILAAPWFVVTVLVALFGLWRSLPSRTHGGGGVRISSGRGSLSLAGSCILVLPPC